jgi:hypothetical protein
MVDEFGFPLVIRSRRRSRQPGSAVARRGLETGLLSTLLMERRFARGRATASRRAAGQWRGKGTPASGVGRWVLDVGRWALVVGCWKLMEGPFLVCFWMANSLRG